MMNEFIILAISKIESDEDKNFIAATYIEYQKLMKATALKRVNKNIDAEDIVQNAVEKLIKKTSLLKTFDCCTLVAYIVFTVESTSIDFLRSRQRHSKSMFLFGDDDAVKDIPNTKQFDQIVMDNYGKETIYAAINQLKPEYKFIIECKYFNNASDKDIAAVLEINPKSVRQYLTRARRALQKILETEYDLNEIQ